MTGSRLQILLELQRHLLTSELEAHVDDPWLPTNSRWILPGIMGSQTFRDIDGRSDVSPLAIADTSKDVDESLRSTDHGCIVSKYRAGSSALKIAERSWGTLRGTQNQTTERRKSGDYLNQALLRAFQRRQGGQVAATEGILRLRPREGWLAIRSSRIASMRGPPSRLCRYGGHPSLAIESEGWRRGWDSNPRAGYPTTRFRGAPVTTTSVPLHGETAYSGPLIISRAWLTRDASNPAAAQVAAFRSRGLIPRSPIPLPPVPEKRLHQLPALLFAHAAHDLQAVIVTRQLAPRTVDTTAPVRGSPRRRPACRSARARARPRTSGTARS